MQVSRALERNDSSFLGPQRAKHIDTYIYIHTYMYVFICSVFVPVLHIPYIKETTTCDFIQSNWWNSVVQTSGSGNPTSGGNSGGDLKLEIAMDLSVEMQKLEIDA